MNLFRYTSHFFRSLLPLTLLAVLVQCEPADNPETSVPTASTGAGASGERWSYHDWPTGPYRVVPDWPKPLPDDEHSHDGWTWGSFGGVYAESPDRIWIAMRGELPLHPGMDPWQPYGATDIVGNAPPDNRRLLVDL